MKSFKLIPNPSQRIKSRFKNIYEKIKLLDSTPQRELKRKISAEVTCLTPRSQARMKIKYDPTHLFSELITQKHSSIRERQNQLSQSTNFSKRNPSNLLRLSNNASEYSFEKGFQNEQILQQEEYLEFQDNYLNMVFDQNGNYLHTQIKPRSKEQLDSIKESYTRKRSFDKLKKTLDSKIESLQPDKVIENMIKSNKELLKHPKQKIISEIKDKVLLNLNGMINQKTKEKIIEDSQNEIQKMSAEMNKKIESLIRENEYQAADLQKSKETIDEFQNQKEQQNLKISCLNQEMNLLKQELEELKKESYQIQEFIPYYKLIKSKFNGSDADQLQFKFEKMEQLCIELNQKIAELEEINSLIKKEKVELKQSFEELTAQLFQKQASLEKEGKIICEKLEEKNMQTKMDEQYKKNYLQLHNRIQNIFIDWSSSTINVYPLQKKNNDNGPIVNIQNPMEMLEMMQKGIKISSPEKLQNYLRKIIVSANILQRKYLPEQVNLRFDPDKIYKRIQKLLDNLKSENVKLQEKIQQFRKEQSNPSQIQNDSANKGDSQKLE